MWKFGTVAEAITAVCVINRAMNFISYESMIYVQMYLCICVSVSVFPPDLRHHEDQANKTEKCQILRQFHKWKNKCYCDFIWNLQLSVFDVSVDVINWYKGDRHLQCLFLE